MEVAGLDHVAIGVRDLERAVDWFSRALGTEFYEIEGTTDVSTEELGARYMLSLNHGIELISPAHPVKETAAPHIRELARLLEANDAVLVRIGFRVENASEQAFAERGIRLAGTVQADEIKPLPLRNIKEFLAREEDTLGIQMIFVEWDRA